MNFINRARRTGKTSMMISAAYVMGIPIVVPNEAMKRCVIDTAKSMHCNIDVFTINEFVSRSMERPVEQVLIDEGLPIIKKAIEQYMGCKVAAVSMTIPMEGGIENEEASKKGGNEYEEAPTKGGIKHGL